MSCMYCTRTRKVHVSYSKLNLLVMVSAIHVYLYVINLLLCMDEYEDYLELHMRDRLYH